MARSNAPDESSSATKNRGFLSLAQVRQGTGWPEGARFILVNPERGDDVSAVTAPDESRLAHYCSERYLTLLEPAEKLALNVATAQVKRGDSVPPNTAAMLIVAVERLEHSLAHASEPDLECDADD